MQSVQLAGMRLLEQIKDILDDTEIAENSLVMVEERYMISSVLRDLIAGREMALRSDSRMRQFVRVKL